MHSFMNRTFLRRPGLARTLPSLFVAALSIPVQAGDWAAYGGDSGGQRHAAISEITPRNVASLEVAWTFRSGELGQDFPRAKEKFSFQATPLQIGDTLYFNTLTGKVFAIDAAHGSLRWQFDAKIDRNRHYSEMAARGVAYWRDPTADAAAPCAQRIVFATLDARLLEIDAKNGKACADFGERGEVALSKGVRLQSSGDYNVTSPPTIAGDVAIVGSAIGDNRSTQDELGVVRAYDLRDGHLRWHWDPIPRTAVIPVDAANPDFGELDQQRATRTGAANAWGVLATDPQRDLVFIPTGSASPDFFGGARPGNNQWANSLVALRASTGAFVWGQQLVHHDLWDYDNAAQPILIELRRGEGTIPAVVQLTKTGQVFVFHRETGVPLYDMEERAVPQDAAPGETPSPTQPFSALPALVSHAQVTADDAWGLTFWDRNRCREQIAALRSEGIYTPPSLQGTILRPGYAGGVNWGSGSWDEQRQLLIVNVMDLPMVVTLIPNDDLSAIYDSGEFEDWEFSRMRGTPYGMRRRALLSPLGVPCTPPPWGKLVAMDLGKGRIAWQGPLGTTRDLAIWPFKGIEGVPGIGGPLTTSSGLTFIGAAAENTFRAFDSVTGKELWSARLPAGPQATPMSYAIGGRQYVVIAAGGHTGLQTTRGDFLIAYALPETPR